MSLYIVILLITMYCNRNKNTENNILYAEYEAPLGYIHLTIFKDSTFEYLSRGIWTHSVWNGKAIINKDSIFFEYDVSIPIVGERAYYNSKYVDFIK